MSIIVSTKILEAVSKWSYPDWQERPHLSVVLFQRGFMVATDGHRLVRVPVETGDIEMAIDRRHIVAAVAMQRGLGNRSIDTLEMSIEGKSVRIAVGSSQLDRDRSGVAVLVPLGNHSKFPPYEKAIPKPDPKAPSPDGHFFNSSYLAAIDEVHVACGGGSQCGIRVVAWARDRLGGMLFEGAGGSQFVIMPMRA